MADPVMPTIRALADEPFQEWPEGPTAEAMTPADFAAAVLEVNESNRRRQHARSVLRALEDPHRTCHGCAHSRSPNVLVEKPDGTMAPDPEAQFPGAPSGESPCGFCVRNPEVRAGGGEPLPWWDHAHASAAGAGVPHWSNGRPALHYPADNYIATDRLMAEHRLLEDQRAALRSGKRERRDDPI